MKKIIPKIDINFDFRSDTPPEKDPDTYSPTLRTYHKFLWSKSLPTGIVLNLDNITRRAYLHYCHSDLGEFFLSSDTMNSSFGRIRHISNIRNQIPKDSLDHLITIMYSIGNMIIFPGTQIEGKWTINQARGCNRSIGDRFDLTLECIRLHYLDQPSPLADTINRYTSFFALF